MAGSTAPGRRHSDVFFWTLRILLASLFLYQGIDKFSDRRLWLRLFEEIGFGQWFRYFTGVVEISGALMLLVPRATLVGVGLLVCTMIGALLVHAFVMGLGPQTVFVAVLLALLCGIGVRHISRKKLKEGQALVASL